MHTKKTYTTREMVIWTRYETISFVLIITACVSGYYFLDLYWLKIPWTPLALIGTAVAFVVGFQNNASYDRIWEARKIWGAIVNDSRSFGAATCSFVQGEKASELQKELIYRHIAWMTALRHQLRLSRPWEHTKERLNK